MTDKPMYYCEKCGAESSSTTCPRAGCNGNMQPK